MAMPASRGRWEATLENLIDRLLATYGPTASGGGSGISEVSGPMSLMLVGSARPGLGALSFVDAAEAGMGVFWFVILLSLGLASFASAALVATLIGPDRPTSAWATVTAALLPLAGLGVGVGVLQGFGSALMVVPLATLALILAMSLQRRTIELADQLVLVATLAEVTIVILLTWAFAIGPVLIWLVLATARVWY